MPTKHKTISIRLAEAEHAALQAAATKHNTAIGTLALKATIALAKKLGAPIRSTTGQLHVAITLYPRDEAALQQYAAANEGIALDRAALAAMRVGLIQRGFLQMEEGHTPDLL